MRSRSGSRCWAYSCHCLARSWKKKLPSLALHSFALRAVAALELDLEPLCFDRNYKQLPTQIL